MSLEAVEILIKTNAKLTQTNREMWTYIQEKISPNQDNYKQLTEMCREIMKVLEQKKNRTINQEVWYRQLKEMLAKIRAVDIDRNNSP